MIDRDGGCGEVLSGDKVTVYGEVDDDTFEGAKIEASSAYVETLGTSFYASARDDEGYQKIETGGLVTVTGDMEADTFEATELMADSIVTLDNDSDS